MTDSWGERLRAILACKKLLQSDVADGLGVSEMTVSKWVRGGGISDKKLKELSAFLGVSRHWLRWGDGEVATDAWVDSGATRKATSGERLLDSMLFAEVGLGVVMWTFNSISGEWLWSQNAPMFFGIERGDDNVPIRDLMHAQMSQESRETGLRLIDDLASGALSHGWMRYSMRGMLDESFLMVGRGTRAGIVTGITTKRSSPLGLAIASSLLGVKSIYELNKPKV